MSVRLYTAVLATSGRWRVIRREGVMAFTIQHLGRDWTDEATVPASALMDTLRQRSLGIPPEDAASLQLSLAFLPATAPGCDLSFDTHTGGAA
jgi:hypothetical protein